MTAPIDLLPWQPIETAPKDRTKKIVRCGKNAWCAVWSKSSEAWLSVPGYWIIRWKPTHWLDIRDTDSA